MNHIKLFEEERILRMHSYGRNKDLQKAAQVFMEESMASKYSYNFSWLGRPIVQYPQDMIAIQEIIWKTEPDLIIETGIAHGGSIIFYASILELIGKGEVLGIDIDIRKHNRLEIEKHLMFKRISMIEGSSISKEIIAAVENDIKGKKSVMVLLDSNHTHDHVLRELDIYSAFVTKGSYLIVFDTNLEDMPDGVCYDRPWGKGNNPKTAVREFLQNNDRFEIDKTIENKLLITVAAGGYLRRKR